MAQNDLRDVCRVSSVSQDLIQIEVLDATELKNQMGRKLTIGSHLYISDDDGHSVIAIVRSYRIKDPAALRPNHRLPVPPSYLTPSRSAF